MLIACFCGDKQVFCRPKARKKFCAQMMLHCTWNDAPPPQCGLESRGGLILPPTTIREFLPSPGGQDVNLGLVEMLQHAEQRLRWKLKKNRVLVRVSEREWVVTSHHPQSIVYSPGKGHLVLRSKVRKNTLIVRNKQRARSVASGSASS
jgi:hypothetical protein